ncbi:hypothetical protein OROGR_009483 [Orobanche gracilis]
MLDNIDPSSLPSDPFLSYSENGNTTGKRKRRPAGTPDPDAEVVSLSPKTLLESDRYVCEICNQGFQRDQNLQMHRRRHKVPWKLLKRETPTARKRVFVCPETSCLHHDPRHALGDLVGIKKHFRRKHSNHKQWVCEKCSKGYAVQSDYKAHLKTCGTRGHSCDCGRVFSRVESFIEHQDACSMGRLRSASHPPRPPLTASACVSRTAPTSSASPSSDDTNLSVALAFPRPAEPIFLPHTADPGCGASAAPKNKPGHPNLELQLLTTSSDWHLDESRSTQLQLSIGSSSEINGDNKTDAENNSSTTEEKPRATSLSPAAAKLKEDAHEQLMVAKAEKALAYAEEARRQAKRYMEAAEQELADARGIRWKAQADLEEARTLQNEAVEKTNSTILQITCHACKHKFQRAASGARPSFLEASSSSSRQNLIVSTALKEWEEN